MKTYMKVSGIIIVILISLILLKFKVELAMSCVMLMNNYIGWILTKNHFNFFIYLNVFKFSNKYKIII